ncbi:DUF1638 domain-containing protein [Geosporobacter ferrireducens]|uniref:DUF1638 domain-containing protein n=1 Tax=Geosporobacter ferrireducens TaxID=1424294 RepID=A0A1D8GJB1_9FIRM|nr:DUF1638 domain-containing protein [Geosporobacter ferrireducens]AOT70996.1 hypothetical protein Gferi_16350 [Geosporobacter ferrireducens]MTI53714.1 DUF1638 domain-containing protein [Geosporobacter ferrireducens]
MNTLIIACRTIADELNMAIQETDCKYPVLWIESGLHLYPDSLKNRLQEELDHITNVDQVLMGFGYCGNALLGITPPTYRMIFPRVDDCISLLLGSCEKRKKISDEMGTYFLTKGWLQYEKNIWSEYQETLERYGKARADKIYKILLQHYKRLGVIETGSYELAEFLEKARLIADDLQLCYQVIPGTLTYMKKLLTGPWDEDFSIIQSGETVTFNHIYGNNWNSTESAPAYSFATNEKIV